MKSEDFYFIDIIANHFPKNNNKSINNKIALI
jgi:hypothetical protein